MKEQVHNPRYPWLVGVAVAGIGAAYFLLLGSSDHPEPGANLLYDVKVYEELDHIETRYQEEAPITLDVQNARALAVHEGRIYAAGQNAVAVLDVRGEEQARFAVEGTPSCLALSPDGRIVLGMTRHVEVLDPQGNPLAEWESLGGQRFITSIAAQEDSVYVADAGRRVVLRYDWQGKLLAQIGQKDLARDIPGLEVPSPYLDLALTPEGDLWVTNPGKLGLERYRENGDIVTSWYHPTLELHGFSGCCNPTQIAFTPQGDLITGEKGIVRLKRYDVTSGEFVELIAGSRDFPRQQTIRDLAVDHEGRILVLDAKTNSLRVFAEKEGAGHETLAQQS
jgi:hypothetical protein